MRIHFRFLHITMLLLLFTTSILFIRNKNLQTKIKTKINVENININNELEAIFYADDFWGLNFPICHLKNITNSKFFFTKFNKPTIILLFFKDHCNECLDNDIKFLQHLIAIRKNESNFDILMIGLNTNLVELQILKKTKNIKFPILKDESDEISKWLPLNISSAIFMVNRNQKIIRAHFPIVGNNRLKDMNYFALERFLSEYLH